ncbi:MAG TPA: DinB family protein [Ignavibacteriaceae bacterium]|nr:DinB family protein [Ignavibacteriaceae bacterium]
MEDRITLKEVLLEQIESAYNVTEKLFKKVDDSELMWKPPAGENWMTIGQLLMHCANYGCGKAVQGFTKGDWGFIESPESNDSESAAHIPSAEMLPSVNSIDEALSLLKGDWGLAQHCIAETDEDEFLTKKIIAPWGGPEIFLFQHLLLMIAHLAQHKGQLFYYLKLMGKDVNSDDLWGI